ncbi:flagellar hook protein [Methylobacterium sp. BTF04]|nr:flagellar hook protein [Methylobacterium sp. BTF04]
MSGSVGNTLGFASGAGTTTTNGTPSGPQTLTINGTAINIAAGANAAAAATAINGQTVATGVTAAVDPSTGHLALTGKPDGTSFTVAASNPGASGFGALPTTVNGAGGASQSLTINNTAIAIPASASLDDAIKAINLQSTITGVTASKNITGGGNKLVLSGASDGSSFSVLGSAGNTLGVATSATKIAGTLDPSPTTLVTALGFKAGDNFSVNGQSVNLVATDTITSLIQKVGAATNGAVTANYDTTSNKFSFTAADTNTAVSLTDGATATSKVANLGFTTTSFGAGLGNGSSSPLQGQSITVQVGTGANVSSTSLTFGSAAGQVSTLSQLNSFLASANAQATIDATTGKISISTTNDLGAENLSIIASGTGNPFTTGTNAAVIGGDGATSRNNLVTSYNNLLTQIDQLAGDAGYNGVNLLTGDNLKISFNEKGSSNLSIQGSSVSAANLGLTAIGQSTFQESSSINKLIDQINTSTNTLKSQASSLGSNLAVVQNRQDFSKQLINILDTGSANLTNADLNEEAANSQALSTRQSLGISALSLANTAQQGVLQLLR